MCPNIKVLTLLLMLVLGFVVKQKLEKYGMTFGGSRKDPSRGELKSATVGLERGEFVGYYSNFMQPYL